MTGLSGCSGLSQRDHEVSTSVWAVEPVSGNFGVKYYKPE